MWERVHPEARITRRLGASQNLLPFDMDNIVRSRKILECESLLSDHYTTRHPPRHFQQVSFHIHNLVLAVPIAREEVLQAIRLEPDGAVDESVLVGALDLID